MNRAKLNVDIGFMMAAAGAAAVGYVDKEENKNTND